MRRKCWVFILIILLPLALAGCWDIKYLDELSIVVALGMDKGEGQELQVTVQVVNPAEVSSGGGKGVGGGGGKGAVFTYSETGQTVFEAIRKIANKVSRKLYFSHTQVLVIGEKLAREEASPLFEFIERDPEVRTDFYVVVAKGAKASDVLKIKPPIEKISGIQIHESIENVEKNLGTSYGVRVKDIIESIGSKGHQFVSGSIEIVGDVKKGETGQNIERTDPSAILKLNGIAVFKDGKLVDFFDLKKSRGISWTQDKVKNTVVNVPCDKKGNAAIEVIRSSTNMRAKFSDGQPSIMIHIRQEANIGETLCPELDVSSEKAFRQLAVGTEQQIREEILDAVKKAQQMKSDIFGFADAVYIANPSYWKQNKNDWEELFAKMPVHIEVITEIRREGTKKKSYYEKHHKDMSEKE